jgi:hypothetical protein
MTTEPSNSTRYWRISPGGGGWLWREQKLHECIAVGWDEVDNAKYISRGKLRSKFRRKGSSEHAYRQFDTFVHEIHRGDKVVASASGKGVYAIGTILGDYEFNKELEYPHSRRVQWETTFWHPVDIEELRLPESLNYKFHGQSSYTIRKLDEKEWNCFCRHLNRIHTPFRNLGVWGGLIQSPEYENEVIILFSHMLERFNMRIVSFGTRFPDAIVERKHYGTWKRVNVEFELYSSGFKAHLSQCAKKHCKTIVCWEDDDWDGRVKRPFEIIELKRELEEML